MRAIRGSGITGTAMGCHGKTPLQSWKCWTCPLTPVYRERILQSAAAQAAAKRQKRARERARPADIWMEYEDDDVALERAGNCAGCDMLRPLDDLGLCPVCAAMLERDLIRQREWEYAASTALLSDEGREALRQQTVDEHGAELELIAPPGCTEPHRK